MKNKNKSINLLIMILIVIIIGIGLIGFLIGNMPIRACLNDWEESTITTDRALDFIDQLSDSFDRKVIELRECKAKKTNNSLIKLDCISISEESYHCYFHFDKKEIIFELSFTGDTDIYLLEDRDCGEWMLRVVAEDGEKCIADFMKNL